MEDFEELESGDQSPDEGASDAGEQRQPRKTRAERAYQRLQSEKGKLEKSLQDLQSKSASEVRQLQTQLAQMQAWIEQQQFEQQFAGLPAEQRDLVQWQRKVQQYEQYIRTLQEERNKEKFALEVVARERFAEKMIDELDLPRYIELPDGKHRMADYLANHRAAFAGSNELRKLAQTIARNHKRDGGRVARDPEGGKASSKFLSGSGASVRPQKFSVETSTLEERDKIATYMKQGYTLLEAAKKVKG